jgi:formiminotetrahydrofolate cyclodeaminase
MARFAEQPLASVLEKVAAATPAPGGGSSAACACALGAALVEMAARIELGRSEGSQIPGDAPERSHALRRHALELAERELSSYAPVLAARRLPAGEEGRTERIAEALVAASATALAIAESAAEAAELGALVANGSAPSVRGDALTGVLLCEAACASAAALVEINLAGLPLAGELQRAREAGRRAQAARAAASAPGPR